VLAQVRAPAAGAGDLCRRQCRAALWHQDRAQIAARVSGLLGRLTERLRPRLVCIACNTASTIALASVREVLEVPIVGTVPAIKPAAALTRSGVIGLLGTQATIRQGYVDRLEAEFAADKRLLRHGAPELVAAAEARLRGQDVDPAVFDRAAQALREQPDGARIDTVVLACTHFPLIEADLGRLWPRRFLHRRFGRDRAAHRHAHAGPGFRARGARSGLVHPPRRRCRSLAPGAGGARGWNASHF
jgi:glutamate racemase